MNATKQDLTSLAEWDAVETRERIRTGSVSTDEVLEAAITRAEASQHLGAIVASTYDRARRTSSDHKYGYFYGVPTFIKDLAQVAGAPTAWGSRASADYVSRKSDPITKRFEETGLVVLGKSACPELGLHATTEPLGSAPCVNPWDLSRSSGGSSGGAASLVSAGVVPIAHGSDGGGSIRIPASCCGLVGLKPSRFRLDMAGSNLLPVNIAADGVITRSVRDTIAFYEALETKRPPKRVPAIGTVKHSSLKPLRIGIYVDTATRSAVASDVKDAVRAAAKLCETLGHEIEEIPYPFYSGVNDDFLRFWCSLAWVQARTGWAMMQWGFDQSKLEPWTSGLIQSFLNAKRDTFASVKRLRTFAQTSADDMKRFDVFISPVLAEAAPKLGFMSGDVAFELVFERIRAYAAFTAVHNVTGCPALALPLGKSADGLPIGVQFAAAHGRDRMLLALALSLEEAQPWTGLAPPRA
ncbi:MAG: amidase [Polyangiaceae bacterium]